MAKKIKIIAILLFFLLSVAGGQYLLFKAYRMHVRFQAKAALREMAANEADLIAFSRKDFSYGLPFVRVPDKADEIILNGEFYDVKDVEITADSVFLFAYRDSDEKFLVAQFEKSARENDQSPLDVLLHHFSSIFTFISGENEINYPFRIKSDFSFLPVADKNCDYLAEAESPPPRVI